MAASPSARRFLPRLLADRRHLLSTHRYFSADAASVTPPSPPDPSSASSSSSSTTLSPPGGDDAPRRSTFFEHDWRDSASGGEFDTEQARVLRSSLLHVPSLGWSESAMIAGAKEIGISPSIVGTFPRKEAALVEFFMDCCLQKLMEHVDGAEEELKNLVLSERLSRLLRIRLEMQIPYVAKWPQALSIQSQPMNIPTSLKQRAMLVDEFWHAAGDEGTDMDWYVRRTILGGIYSTSEIYMLTDNSPDHHETWKFVNQRIRDAIDLRKTVQEAGHIVGAVGASMGTSVQGLLNRVFKV